jgi:Xaa-Pro aminopeptidase
MIITLGKKIYFFFFIDSEDLLFKGLSFDSISAVGKHAADIHFSTANITDVPITTNEIYLLDAGAQYL